MVEIGHVKQGSPEPANIEADTFDDTGSVSDYGSSIASSTTSVSSSVFEYQYENGRRYHAYRAGQYLLPNDELEQDRLDMTHHIFRLALGGDLCITKLDHPQRILDVGTGTGIWAIESIQRFSPGNKPFGLDADVWCNCVVGDEYPSAQVLGTDLSPIQPTWVPPNVQFEIEDANDEWTYAPNSFDFIHARTLAGSIFDWNKFLRSCYRHAKPGGHVEIAEGRANFWCDDGTLPEDSYTAKWLAEFNRIERELNLNFDVFPSLSSHLHQQGFTDIQTKEFIVPVGPWPKDKRLKEIGRWFLLQFVESGLQAYSLALFTRNGWTEAEVQVLLAGVRAELKQLVCNCDEATLLNQSAGS
ncbi:hypothetical protein MPDQ_005413 [Monascus purpureus]|uniref:Methyltransferase domain-containing protein n=1 Tax=Monascus purpureus TaxID=5098 RepID=A0A507R038_MONPU|nr:hypothetical protein MPDQ_005413 [Monascus purpureus]